MFLEEIPAKKLLGKSLNSSICLFSYQKTNLKRMNDTSRDSAKKQIRKIGGAQKEIDIGSSQGYAIREILWYDRDDKGNLTKHKKRDPGALRTTSWYSGVPL